VGLVHIELGQVGNAFYVRECQGHGGMHGAKPCSKC
jgi:hypothetical protein